MKKTFIIAIIFLVTIIGVGAYYFGTKKSVNPNPQLSQNFQPPQSPQPSATETSATDTSAWLTYRSEKFGYEIKYPKGAEAGDDGVGLLNYFGISKDNLEKELSAAYYYPFGVGISIRVFYFPKEPKFEDTKYSTPCEWYYAEVQNLDIMDYDPDICLKGKPYGEAGGWVWSYPTTFEGELAYVYEEEDDGTNGGLYAKRHYNIAFFHNGHPWLIGYNKLPNTLTEKWKNHPYYKYLVQAQPIIETIINSFRFTDSAKN